MWYNDQRQDDRVQDGFPVTMQTDQGGLVRKVKDISYGGMGIHRGIALARRGDDVVVRFRIPDGSGTIQCAGKIVHEDEDVLGIQFKELSVRQLLMLDRYLTQRLREQWYR